MLFDDPPRDIEHRESICMPNTEHRGPGAADGEWDHNAVEIGAVHDYLQVENDEGVDFWLFHAGDGEDAWTVPDRVHP